jgi:uncharacterized protein YjlB
MNPYSVNRQGKARMPNNVTFPVTQGSAVVDVNTAKGKGVLDMNSTQGLFKGIFTELHKYKDKAPLGNVFYGRMPK